MMAKDIYGHLEQRTAFTHKQKNKKIEEERRRCDFFFSLVLHFVFRSFCNGLSSGLVLHSANLWFDDRHIDILRYHLTAFVCLILFKMNIKNHEIRGVFSIYLHA